MEGTEELLFFPKEYSISQEDIDLTTPHLKKIELSKKEDLFQPHDSCNGLYLLKSGLLRIYSYSDGNDITVAFLKEGDYYTDFASIFTKSPCNFMVQAIENTTIIYFPYNKLLETYKISHSIESFGRQMVERAFLHTLQTFSIIRQGKPMISYENFEKENPEFANRIPLKHLASFLGITPESLSRIRKRRLSS